MGVPINDRLTASSSTPRWPSAVRRRHRWVRNLEQRPEVSVSLPDDDHAVVLEGQAVWVTEPDLPIAAAVRAANVSKYPQYFADAGDEFSPFWALRPRRVFAWSLTGFPTRATRFDFSDR